MAVEEIMHTSELELPHNPTKEHEGKILDLRREREAEDIRLENLKRRLEAMLSPPQEKNSFEAA
jgi:hypothetical protein